VPEEGCETIPGRVVFGRSQRPVLAVFVCDNPAVAVAMVQFDCSWPADQVDKTTIDCPCVSVLRQVTEIIGPLDRFTKLFQFWRPSVDRDARDQGSV